MSCFSFASFILTFLRLQFKILNVDLDLTIKTYSSISIFLASFSLWVLSQPMMNSFFLCGSVRFSLTYIKHSSQQWTNMGFILSKFQIEMTSCHYLSFTTAPPAEMSFFNWKENERRYSFPWKILINSDLEYCFFFVACKKRSECVLRVCMFVPQMVYLLNNFQSNWIWTTQKALFLSVDRWTHNSICKSIEIDNVLNRKNEKKKRFYRWTEEKK